MAPEPSLDAKLAKIRSPNLESQKQTGIVLRAVDETVKDQNTESLPTAYFSALLSLLGKSNKETITSVVYLLDIVTPFVPTGILRYEFTQIVTLLAPVLATNANAEAPLLRPAIGCLESLLLAQDGAAWQMSADQIGPRQAISRILSLALDKRPKVKKRAQDAIKTVLQNPPPSPSLDHPAADMCGETAMRSLEQEAVTAASARKQKSTNDSHALKLGRALQLVKAIATASNGWPTSKIEPLCELLLGIARAGNQHMTDDVFKIFEMIFQGMVGEVASAKLPRVVEIISELRPAINDTQLLPPWIGVLSRAYDVSAQVEPEETFQKLPELFEMMAQFMESPAQNIRISASNCLTSFVENCVPEQVILQPSIYDEKTLEKLAKVAESLLTVKYQAAWLETFKFLGTMFDALKWRSYPMLINVARNVGEIRGNDSFMGKKQADEVIGKAIRAMGPEAVLSVLPLNLSNDQPGRAWMLPLLRDSTSNTNLEHFKKEFIPLSVAVFKKVEEDGEAKSMGTKIFDTVFHQIWSLLPGYCDLPLDLIQAFDQSFAELLATVLYEKPTLRLDVCRSMKALVESNKEIATIEEEENLILQFRLTKEQAQKNLDHLSTFASNMLAVLFNVYTQTLPQSRGPILQTINAFVDITPQTELIETFNRVCQMLSESLSDPVGKKQQGQKDQMPSTAQTLMDIVITMSAHLPRDSFATLFEISATIIKMDNDPQLQKKAYKLIPRLADSEIGQAALKERNAEIQALILASSEKVTAPARRDRLAAIAALIPFLPDTSLHFIPSVLSEVVISCKEHNEKARLTAFDLIILMGNRLQESKGAMIENSEVPGLPTDAPSAPASIDEYLTMLSAGLAGGTPHMISATITALSRVLYEFWRSVTKATLVDMVQTLDLFLTSNNREVVKSCLGFVKVCVITLPVDLMLPRLESLVPNLLIWSNEHKGHFKAKVKHMLERMIRRFGYEIINNYTPEDDRKLIANIKKTKERAKRKKDEARNGAVEDGDSEEEFEGDGKYDNALDEALYSSSESEDEEGDGGVDFRKGAKNSGKSGRGDTYIIEDEDEPLDLLDRKALANISSTKPMRGKPLRGPTKARMDLDGKLILGDAKGGARAVAAAASGDSAMDIDVPAGGEESGVGAYVAALKGGNLARKKEDGRIKFSNKRRDMDDDEMEIDGKDVEAIRKATAAAGRGRGWGTPRGGDRGMGRGRGLPRGGGRGGGRGGSGRGVFANGRRGLGEEKRRGGMGGARGGRVMKSPRRGGR